MNTIPFILNRLPGIQNLKFALFSRVVRFRGRDFNLVMTATTTLGFEKVLCLL